MLVQRLRALLLPIVSTLAVAFFSSCSTQLEPITIPLDPQVVAPKINLGSGKKVLLTVTNERPDEQKLLFNLVSHPSVILTMTTSEPLSLVLFRNIEQALTNMGFEAVSSLSASDTLLNLNILEFAVYDRTSQNDVWVKARVEIIVEVLVSTKEAQAFTKRYDIGRDFTLGFLDSHMTVNINSAISELIYQVIGDLELITALQSGGHKTRVGIGQ